MTAVDAPLPIQGGSIESDSTSAARPSRLLRNRRNLVVALIALVCVLMSANGFVVRYSEGGVQDAASLGRALTLACDPWIPWLLLAIPLAWLFTAVSVVRGPLWRFLGVHFLAAGAIAGGLVWGWDRITEPLLRSTRKAAVMDMLRGSLPAEIYAHFASDPLTRDGPGGGYVSLEMEPDITIQVAPSLPNLELEGVAQGEMQVFGAVEDATSGGIQFWSSERPDLVPALSTHILAYLVLLALSQGLLFYREMTREREEAALMRSRYDRMRLDSLRSHIDPHFLYNALTAISSTSREDGETARSMIGDLSTLMRASSAREGSLRTTLDDELALTAAYVSLIQRRFKERFAVELDVDDEARECFVPAWTLQPLLENVVVHGVHDTKATVTARVAATLEGGVLRLAVSDDAPAKAESSSHLGGTALENLRERLGALFGPGSSLEAGPDPNGGFRTTVRVPQGIERSES